MELTLLVEPGNYSYFSDKNSAKNCCNYLLSAFENSGSTRKVALLQKIVSEKFKNHVERNSQIDTLGGRLHSNSCKRAVNARKVNFATKLQKTFYVTRCESDIFCHTMWLS